MSTSPYSVEDLHDLPFDLRVHAEALKAFAVLNLLPPSIRPTLRARNVTFVRFPSTQFRIGVTENPESQEKLERDNGSVAFEVLYQAADTEEGNLIRAEVERYFRRHFPRRLRDFTDGVTGEYVYITCYSPVSEDSEER